MPLNTLSLNAMHYIELHKYLERLIFTVCRNNDGSKTPHQHKLKLTCPSPLFTLLSIVDLVPTHLQISKN
jgi:hypothetical protein